MTENVIESVVVALLVAAIIFISRILFVRWHEKNDAKKIYDWLVENSDMESEGKSSWETSDIASNTNLLADRVESLCDRHVGIYRVIKSRETRWSIHYREAPGFFDIDWPGR